MLYPSIVVDNFFSQPELIVDFASKLKFYQNKDGRWPGKRTESLHLIAPQIHRHVGRKVLATLFPNNYTKITYNLGDLYFQKISSEFCNTGWIHVDDPAELTIIIYLSKHKKCGTSIFDYVKAFPTNDESSKKKFNILQQNNLNIVTTPREYFGPVNLYAMNIQLLDEYGRIVDLSNMDFSFCLNLSVVYDL